MMTKILQGLAVFTLAVVGSANINPPSAAVIAECGGGTLPSCPEAQMDLRPPSIASAPEAHDGGR